MSWLVSAFDRHTLVLSRFTWIWYLWFEVVFFSSIYWWVGLVLIVLFEAVSCYDDWVHCTDSKMYIRFEWKKVLLDQKVNHPIDLCFLFMKNIHYYCHEWRSKPHWLKFLVFLLHTFRTRETVLNFWCHHNFHFSYLCVNWWMWVHLRAAAPKYPISYHKAYLKSDWDMFYYKFNESLII